MTEEIKLSKIFALLAKALKNDKFSRGTNRAEDRSVIHDDENVPIRKRLLVSFTLYLDGISAEFDRLEILEFMPNIDIEGAVFMRLKDDFTEEKQMKLPSNIFGSPIKNLIPIFESQLIGLEVMLKNSDEFNMTEESKSECQAQINKIKEKIREAKLMVTEKQKGEYKMRSIADVIREDDGDYYLGPLAKPKKKKKKEIVGLRDANESLIKKVNDLEAALKRCKARESKRHDEVLKKHGFEPVTEEQRDDILLLLDMEK